MKKKTGLYIFLTLCSFSLLGCLKTRGDLRGTSQAAQVQQQQNAQIDNRFYEIDKDFRELYGKIETIEAQIGPAGGDKQSSGEASSQALEKIQALESRINTLEEAILSLDKRVSGDKSSRVEPQELSTKAKQVRIDVQEVQTRPKGDFQLGEFYFAKKNYSEAIQAFDRYRKRYPQGQYYSVATYNIGESFRRIQRPSDAKSFYSEVVQRFPKTRLARRANKRLKSL